MTCSLEYGRKVLTLSLLSIMLTVNLSCVCCVQWLSHSQFFVISWTLAPPGSSFHGGVVFDLLIFCWGYFHQGYWPANLIFLQCIISEGSTSNFVFLRQSLTYYSCGLIFSLSSKQCMLFREQQLQIWQFNLNIM